MITFTIYTYKIETSTFSEFEFHVFTYKKVLGYFKHYVLLINNIGNVLRSYTNRLNYRGDTKLRVRGYMIPKCEAFCV